MQRIYRFTMKTIGRLPFIFQTASYPPDSDLFWLRTTDLSWSLYDFSFAHLNFCCTFFNGSQLKSYNTHVVVKLADKIRFNSSCKLLLKILLSTFF